jgi:glycosyltransferase involved in cell wall biosynthesis
LLYGYFGKFKTQILILVERMFAAFSDLMIVSGDKVCADLISARIGNLNKFKVIRPGVFIDRKKLKETFRETLNLNSRQIVIGWLGRLAQIKRPDRVIELAKVLPEFEFLIGGEGDELSREKGIAPRNVHFLGWVEPEAMWSSVDIAILTSENEAQPIALVEASLFSIPIVAFDVGSVSEVVSEGKTGYLVTDISEMKDAVIRLASDSTLRKKLGSNGFKLASQKFSQAKFISDHIDAYLKAEEIKRSKTQKHPI